MENCGYGRRALTPFFVLPSPDSRLERLLAALGLTYSKVMQDLTVLPFWMSFNRATASRFQINLDPATGRISRLSLIGNRHFFPGAQYCPSCLAADLHAHGEVYVHRQHQLPVATVCALHSVPLRSACPACAVTVLPINRSLLRPPPLSCECGQDLTEATPPLPHHHNLLRLARFARDALLCKEAPWTRAQIMTLLRKRSNEFRANFGEGAARLLRSAYGSTDINTLISTSSAVKEASLPFQLNEAQLELLRAPVFCALLAATGLEFEEFRDSIRYIADGMWPTRVTRTLSSEEALARFEKLESESPGRGFSHLRQRGYRPFFLVCWHYGDLLREKGYTDSTAFPTIAADRVTVERNLHVRRRCHDSAFIRASIRDKDWLRALLSKARTARFAAQSAEIQGVNHEMVMTLSRAVFSILRTQARPARISAVTLAPFAQLSMAKTQRLVKHAPALHALIEAVNAGKDRRLAFWAAKLLVSEGSHPSAKQILRRAGLPSIQVNFDFCREAAEWYGLTWSRRGPLIYPPPSYEVSA